jgi:hypothetical protein
MSTPKKDSLGRAIGKRRDNGPEDQGLGQDSQIVRGPKALLEAMRKRAELDGQKVAEAWRRAAELYLKTK